MSEFPKTPEDSGADRRIPGDMSALSEDIIEAAEQITAETANGKPGDTPSAMQGMNRRSILFDAMVAAEQLRALGPDAPDGRLEI